MRHIQYEIEEQPSYHAVVVFVELPDITKRATFQVAHAALLDAFGIERAKNWLLHFQTSHQTDARDLIQDLTQSGDIAIVFSNLLGFGEASRIVWDWLRGVKLSVCRCPSSWPTTDPRPVGPLREGTSNARSPRVGGRGRDARLHA